MCIKFLAIQKFITSQLLSIQNWFSRGQAVVSFVKFKQLIHCCSICRNEVDNSELALEII